jgi:DNA modification methylase
MNTDSLPVEMIAISELKPYSNNAKLHPQDQIEKIVRSINLTGFDQPIVVNKEGKDLVIIKGHGRLEAAKQMGLKEVPVIVLEVDKEVADKARLIDNKSAESEYDLEILISELQKLSEDLPNTGYSEDELNELIAQLESEIEIEDDGGFDEEKQDEIPEVENVETRVKLGDIWQLGNHLLLCGDCTIESNIKELLGDRKVDMVFTDPPYGINTSIANDDLSEKELFEFNLKWSKIAFDYLKNNSSVVVFHSTRLFWTALDALRKNNFRFLRYLTLYKPNDCTYPWHRWILKSESILLFEKGKSEFLRVEPYTHDTIQHLHGKDQSEDRGGHPCCKPISFIEDFIKPFKGKLVADFFMGSGTTLIACEKTNRIAIGTEISPKYCDVILKRWENLTGKTATFVRNINS